MLPDLNKTAICKDWENGVCNIDGELCTFAHGVDDLRSTEIFAEYARAGRNTVINNDTENVGDGEHGVDDLSSTGLLGEHAQADSDTVINNDVEITRDYQMPGSIRPETIWQDRPDENVAATAEELALIAARLLTLSPSMLHSIVPLLQGTVLEKKIEVALKMAMPEHYED